MGNRLKERLYSNSLFFFIISVYVVSPYDITPKIKFIGDTVSKSPLGTTTKNTINERSIRDMFKKSIGDKKY